ncbi:alpha/beta hydrolase family protein [Antribacter gilvus]|uniref:alpha/beta hydrolase family protein n=1 Tax=Antribacter gilvus TaxID=2304675 RepID=UPI000F7B92DB|nr:alpha/beta hydrolase [Antribacter gilvus]
MSVELASPQVTVHFDESRRSFADPTAARPVRVSVWDRDASDPSIPTVVVSHGAGGSVGAMDWMIDPLVSDGFQVVAVDHHGASTTVGYEPEGFIFPWERARDLRFALDVVARDRQLGPVGAAGFSAGAYAAAATVGARLDRRIIGGIFTGRIPFAKIPEYPRVLEIVQEKYTRPQLLELAADSASDMVDPRVRSVFQVAPLGSIVDAASLATIRVPVESWWGGADRVTPLATDARPYLDRVPGIVGREIGPRVRHQDFFPIRSADADARARMGEAAVRFFRQTLTEGQVSGR